MNFLDYVRVGTAGCLTVTTSAVSLAGSPLDAVAAGDTLEYTVEVTNPGSVTVAGPLVHDTVPDGLAYVPGSVRILDGPQPGPRTDTNDGDGLTVTAQQIDVDLATTGPATIPPAQQPASPSRPPSPPPQPDRPSTTPPPPTTSNHD